MPIRGYLCTGLILLAQAIYCAAFLSANPLGRSPFGPGTKAIRERRGWHCPEQRATQPRGVVRMTGATKLLAMAAPAMVETTYEIAYPEGQQIDSNVEAFLFDCDGTLVDSMPMWTENWRATCEHFGLHFENSFLYRHAGKTIEKTLVILCEEQGKEVDPKEFFEWKAKNMAELIPLVKEITPVAQIARENQGRVRMAVVSSGPRNMVTDLLAQAGLLDAFEFSVCAEDVVRHKPFPDPYLEAAKKLGIDPSLCRVFEDAEAGIRAGLSAGMQTVDVRRMPGYPVASILE